MRLVPYMCRISWNTLSIHQQRAVCVFTRSIPLLSPSKQTCLRSCEITLAAQMKTSPLFLGSHLHACFVCLCILRLSSQHSLMSNKAAVALWFQLDRGRCLSPTPDSNCDDCDPINVTLCQSWTGPLLLKHLIWMPLYCITIDYGWLIDTNNIISHVVSHTYRPSTVFYAIQTVSL